MDTYAVLNSENIVVNLIVWDGRTPYDPGPGMRIVVAGQDAAIGYLFDGLSFIAPVQIVSEGAI